MEKKELEGNKDDRTLDRGMFHVFFLKKSGVLRLIPCALQVRRSPLNNPGQTAGLCFHKTPEKFSPVTNPNAEPPPSSLDRSTSSPVSP